jgi:hypothetical protein
MGRPDRAAEIGAIIDVVRRERAARAAARRFIELHELHLDAAPIVQALLDELIEPGCARLEAELLDGRGG